MMIYKKLYNYKLRKGKIMENNSKQSQNNKKHQMIKNLVNKKLVKLANYFKIINQNRK